MAKARKAKKRLEDRIKDYEAMKLSSPRGYHRPGSLKK